MKIIESSVEIIPQESGLEGIYKQCELAGRTAYKSEDRITEGSAKKFVEALMKLKHGAVLEHGTIYLRDELKLNEYNEPFSEWSHLCVYENNKYSKVSRNKNYIYVTTNLRVLMENDWMDDLQYLCEPTEYHEKRATVKFICSRSIAQEITRHRVFSFLMESQRYVAYNKDKFGGEITYIVPEWVKNRTFYVASCIDSLTNTSNSYILDEPTLIDTIRIHMLALDRATCCWWESLKKAEEDYMYLLTDECGLKAEEARSVLPNDCKTELIMTGFVSDWNHFFDLRSKGTTGKPHPDIKVLADYLLLQFTESKLI